MSGGRVVQLHEGCFVCAAQRDQRSPAVVLVRVFGLMFSGAADFLDLYRNLCRPHRAKVEEVSDKMLEGEDDFGPADNDGGAG